MASYLLDTNILVDHLRKYKSILPFVQKCRSQKCVLRISAITRAEIQAGQTVNHPLQAKKVEALLSIFDTVPLDELIADQAGALKRKHDSNIVDAIIAASAIFTESILLTRNTKHFQKISGLKIKSAL